MELEKAAELKGFVIGCLALMVCDRPAREHLDNALDLDQAQVQPACDPHRLALHNPSQTLNCNAAHRDGNQNGPGLQSPRSVLQGAVVRRRRPL